MRQILVLCSGNICRSPLAAQLLKAKLVSTQTQSAGTSVLVGEHTPDEALSFAKDLGLTGAEAHRAAVMTPQMVAQADVILGMERTHRRKAALMQPAAGRRAFTLLEFAHITAEMTDDQLCTVLDDQSANPTAAVDVVARLRGMVSRLDESFYDVEDPYGRSKYTYQRATDQIVRAIDQIVAYVNRVDAVLSNTRHRTIPTERTGA